MGAKIILYVSSKCISSFFCVSFQKNKLLWMIVALSAKTLSSSFSYLKLSLDENEIRSQDVTNVIIDVSRNSIGRYLAWEFMQENWETLRQKYDSH